MKRANVDHKLVFFLGIEPKHAIWTVIKRIQTEVGENERIRGLIIPIETNGDFVDIGIDYESKTSWDKIKRHSVTENGMLFIDTAVGRMGILLPTSEKHYKIVNATAKRAEHPIYTYCVTNHGLRSIYQACNLFDNFGRKLGYKTMHQLHGIHLVNETLYFATYNQEVGIKFELYVMSETRAIIEKSSVNYVESYVKQETVNTPEAVVTPQGAQLKKLPRRFQLKLKCASTRKLCKMIASGKYHVDWNKFKKGDDLDDDLDDEISDSDQLRQLKGN